MKLISADKTKCVKCGACADVCPMGVIYIDDHGFPEPTRDAFRLCINCGYCVDVCVPVALSHKVRKASNNPQAALERYAASKKRKNSENP